MRKLTDFINVTAAVLLGLFLISLIFIRNERLLNLSAWLSTPSVIVFAVIIGLLLVAVNLNVLVQEWKIGGLRRNLRITTDNGPSDLWIAGLESLLLRELKAQGDILDPLVTLEARAEGHPMLCLLEYRLKRQDDVLSRSDAIKRLVRDTFQRLIPSGVTIEIRSEIRDFVEDMPVEKPLKKDEFQGPVYDYANNGDDDDEPHHV